MNSEAMRQKLREMAAARDWDQFHTPKNLVMALSGEVGELTELFQWLTPGQAEGVMQDSSKAQAIADELADILSYTLRLADKLGVDLERAFWNKASKTEQKYPVEKAKGNARKYTDFE